jgi:hypothetical protein
MTGSWFPACENGPFTQTLACTSPDGFNAPPRGIFGLLLVFVGRCLRPPWQHENIMRPQISIISAMNSKQTSGKTQNPLK